MQKAKNIFRALSDINRLRIIKMLEVKPLCVCEITKILGIAASTASSHLSILRDARLIGARKDGRWVEYYLNTNSDSVEIRQQLSLIAGWINDGEVVASDREQLKKADRNIICNS